MRQTNPRRKSGHPCPDNRDVIMRLGIHLMKEKQKHRILKTERLATEAQRHGVRKPPEVRATALYPIFASSASDLRVSVPPCPIFPRISPLQKASAPRHRFPAK